MAIYNRAARPALAVGALLALLLAGAAKAQDGIYNVSILGSSLSTDTANSETSADGEVGHDAPGAGAVSVFTSRYGFNVNADSRSFSIAKVAQAVHQVSFEVRSTTGYELVISTGWVGQLIRQGDNPNCNDAVSLSQATGEVIAGFGLRSGSLTLPNPPGLSSGPDDAIIEVGAVVDAVIRVNNPSPVEIHTLRFNWEGGVISDTCEVAVRLGASSGTTTECAACGYPGDPPRVKAQDGHFVNVQFVPSKCGNGSVDAEGEECDLGTGNGFGACCDVFCKLEPDNMPCGDALFCNGDGRCAAGVCEELGDPCSGCGCDELNDVCMECTPTPTGTRIENTATPTATVAATCPGDCDGLGTVSIGELITGVLIALQQRSLSACMSFDINGNGVVAVNELIQAVGRALNGCA